MATIKGNFHDIKDNDWYVEIQTSTYTGNVFNTNDEDSKVLFVGEEPVVIETEIENTFTPIIKRTCQVTLLTRVYLGNFIFTASNRDNWIKVYKNSKLVFAGFIEPNAYTQPYSDYYDSFTITATDLLSGLDSYNYKGVSQFIDGLKTEYKDVKQSAKTVSFANILANMLSLIKSNIPGDFKVWYDNSKTLEEVITPNNEFKRINFEDLSISELLFIGESEDDVWTYEEIFKQLLQYLNLHAVQEGYDIYLFDWDMLRNNTVIRWTNIFNMSDTKTEAIVTINLDQNSFASSDINLSVEEVYNKIQAKCKIENIEKLITSPLDDDSLVSPYTNKNKFMREYLLNKDNAEKRTWYYQHYVNTSWTLKYYDEVEGRVKYVNDLVKYDKDNVAINQWKIPYEARKHVLCPLLGKFGQVKDGNANDDTISSKLNMDTCLAITVNGSRNYGDSDSAKAYQQTVIDKWNNIIDKTGGICEFNSNIAGGALSPSEDSVTNYIVFGGKIALQPPLLNMAQYSPSDGFWTWLLLSRQSDSMYVKWYNGTYPKNEDGTTPLSPQEKSFVPYLGYEELQNKFSEYYGDHFYYKERSDTDTISKIPILICQLKVGDKYCIEVEEGQFRWIKPNANGKIVINGQEGDPVFYLGFNPKVGDYLLEHEFPFQNNLTVAQNIDAEGTAIPIKKSDELNGNIEFKILGLHYGRFAQQIRKHGTWFRKTKWWTEDLAIMEAVETVFIKDFTCKIYSDSALVNNIADNDLIFASDENTRFNSLKDDIEFNFNSGLTIKECQDKGVQNTINMSTVLYKGNPVLNMTNLEVLCDDKSFESAKPEELYISSYFQEYSKPKVLLECDLQDDLGLKMFNKVYYKQMNKTFIVQKLDYNSKNSSVHVILKET